MTDTATNAIDRSRPPAPGATRDVSFPDYFESVLPNGLKVIVYEERFLPMVTMNLVVRGGAVHDGPMPGLASMSAELLTKGTETRTATGIADEIEALGGSISTGAGWDSLSVGVSILSRYLERALEVVADVAMRPTFPEEEIARAREQRIASIMQRKANPSSLAYQRFCAAVFPAHPYGAPSEGTEVSVRALEREHLRAFHRRQFVPNNAFLLVVGDVTPSTLLPAAERLFGGWKRGDSLRVSTAEPAMPARRLVQVVDRPTAVQSSLLVGHPGIPRGHEDYIAVSLLNTLLGGYFGSRLNLNLREDKGFTYGAHSRFEARAQAGPFAAGAEVRNEVTDAAVSEILAEIRSLVDSEVALEELAGVQRYVTGNFPIQIETPAQVAQRIVTIELYGLGKTYYNTFNSRVMAVTPADIHAAAQRHLHPDALAIVAAGRASQLVNTLARFGTVEVFDADGAPVSDISTNMP